MQGKPLETTKNVLSEALNDLDSKDSFNILGFNGESYLFSSSMELATGGTIERAVQWLDANFIAGGTTNMLHPFTQAIEMVSTTQGSLPIIFFITDGAVEEERHICDIVKSHVTGGGSICPRVYSFGIGSYCNHYFLRMLAMISKGQHDAAVDIDSIESRMKKLLRTASSPVLVNVALDSLEYLDDVEICPPCIPDLSSESPLIVSGRYRGNFPDIFKARGVLGDLKDFVVGLKVQKAKDMSIDQVLAKRQIDLLTAQAWFSESKEIEEKVAKISIRNGIVSEYTRMVLLENDTVYQVTESPAVHKLPPTTTSQTAESQSHRILLRSFGVGFGNLIATADNIPPGVEEPKIPQAAELIIKAASNCCGKMCTRCCCMCCIQCCTKMNDQCAIVLVQLCTALVWFGCFECCAAICCSGDDGH